MIGGDDNDEQPEYDPDYLSPDRSDAGSGRLVSHERRRHPRRSWCFTNTSFLNGLIHPLGALGIAPAVSKFSEGFVNASL